MTLVARTIVTDIEGSHNDGDLFWDAPSSQWKWRNHFGAVEVQPGSPNNFPYVGRMSLDIPPRARIVSANFRIAYGMKDGNQANSCTLRCYVEDSVNAPAFPHASETLMGGTFPRALRDAVDTTITHAAGAAGPFVKSVSMANAIQNLVNSERWRPGNFVTVYLESIAETNNMSIYHTEQAFSDHCSWEIVYEYDDTSPDRFVVNRLFAQTMEDDARPDWEDVGFTNIFFDTRASGTTRASSTAVGGAPGAGGSALAVTANPATGEEGRSWGWSWGGFLPQVGDVISFSGWFYNPAVNGEFRAGLVYHDAAVFGSTLKNQWAHFATTPYKWTASEVAFGAPLYPTVDVVGPSAAGRVFYVDGLNLRIESKDGAVREFPWHALSTPKTGRRIFVTEKATYGPTVQQGAIATYVLDGGVVKPRRRFAFARAAGLQSVVGLVWTDTKKANLWSGHAGALPSSAAARTDHVAYSGRHWMRLSRLDVGGITLRHYVPAADLVNGASYVCSAEVANDTASTISITWDWCDEAAQFASIAPGEVRTISVTASRTTYDAVYRFFDISVTSPAAGLLVRHPRVVAV